MTGGPGLACHQVDMGAVVGSGGVRLLPVDDELVAHPLGRALESCQVSPGIGLGVPAGEVDVVVDGRNDILRLLLRRAVGGNGWHTPAAAPNGQVRTHELFFDDVLIDAAAALAA